MITVALERASVYEVGEVRTALEKTIANLGGLEHFFVKGQRILLKANLLMKKKPEEATTTHPVFMRALADILTDYGLEVLVADSPGGPFNEARLRSLYAYCGYAALEENPKVQLNYNTESMEIQTPQGRFLKRMSVIKVLDEVDHVISVSKLKTHGMMRFTGAVKNMFGIIPGILKAEYHFTLPKLDDFADGLIDICLARQPILSFMDGIVAMEGHGPSGGDPRPVGLVLASTSPFHLDVVACRVIGLGIADVPILKQAEVRGLINKDGLDIQVVGEAVEGFAQKDFSIPKVRGLSFFDRSPDWIKRPLERVFKPNPVFDHKTCIGCSDCALNCPPKVIAMVAGKPVVDLDGCIRCFCCQELCPVKAVQIKRSKLLDKIAKM